MSTEPPVLILCRDLLFQSKITAAANESGVPVRTIRLPEKIGVEPGRILIVDLNQPGAIAAAAAWRGKMKKPVVGFVSHVDGATVAEAKLAGIDRVMARSAFVNQLSDLLKSVVP